MRGGREMSKAEHMRGYVMLLCCVIVRRVMDFRMEERANGRPV